jgi:hypothetical protein
VAYWGKTVTTVQSRRWVFILPAIHLAACLTIYVGGFRGAWQYLIIADFPASLLVAAAMALVGEDSPFALPVIWFGFIGTLWWFSLCWFVSYLLKRAGGPPFRPEAELLRVPHPSASGVCEPKGGSGVTTVTALAPAPS